MRSLIAEIKQLEQESKALDATRAMRQEWNEATLDYADNFLDVHARKAYQPEIKKPTFATEFSEPTAIEDVLHQIHQDIDSTGIDTASANYLGFIPGGGLYPAALGDYLAAVSNRYAGNFYVAPGAVRLENTLIQWLCELIGFPKSASGNLTSGGSIANLIALVTAREAFELKSKDFSRVVVYLTNNTHASSEKGLKVIGLGDAIIRRIPVDANYCMQADVLAIAIQEDRAQGLIPWLTIASAGTTDTGSVDPLDKIAAITHAEKLWLHVDAAYGGFFALIPEGKKLFSGIEKADSVILDPHKGLFLPYGTGAVLIRQQHLQRKAFAHSAACLQECEAVTEELSPSDLSPELTKHFRALRMWLPLKLFGLEPFRAALKEKILLAKYFHEQIKTIPQLEIACSPQLSIVAFRYLPTNEDANIYNAALLKAINDDGRICISSTRLDGNFYLRMACLSFRTHWPEINLAIEVLREKISM